MKYRICTLGCKVNQFETQAIEALLTERGMRPAADGEEAELVIVNTCCVTAESGRKSRQAIRRLMNENPGAVSAVCGCFSQLSPEEVESIGADIVHGSGDKKRLCDDIFVVLEDKRSTKYVDNPFSRHVFEELSGGAIDSRTRAMLKIQDGCVNFCTYCIIPYTRGRVRSLPPERCAHQAEELAKQGFSELVITGIEIASYGADFLRELGLIDAIEAIASACGGMRLRLGSLEPTVITEDFCARLAAAGKICDHFHLSLQSGSDEVLKAMNRKYTSGEFSEALGLLRRYFPGCGVTADLIVGFPGETQEQHGEAMRFIEKCGFSAMHIFPFSKRPGTRAAELKGQLTNAEKSKRAAEAKVIADCSERVFLSSCVGKRLEVVFEASRDGASFGHAANYAAVCISGDAERGRRRSVEITGADEKQLFGRIV